MAFRSPNVSGLNFLGTVVFAGGSVTCRELLSVRFSMLFLLTRWLLQRAVNVASGLTVAYSSAAIQLAVLARGDPFLVFKLAAETGEIDISDFLHNILQHLVTGSQLFLHLVRPQIP